ncbi:MAG: hypothetical protein MST11_09855 [Spirochaetia bacterium]|nr:hypothetical protein [Spirochaetia bacterium]MDY4707185.1 hypothetical protein [Candidatus Treponema excrementipullorum]
MGASVNLSGKLFRVSTFILNYKKSRMKEFGEKPKDKINRYRDFTASVAGLPLSLILLWIAGRQPFSGEGILLCLLLMTGAAVSFLTAVINGIIAFIRLKKESAEKSGDTGDPAIRPAEPLPALFPAFVITGCVFAGACLPLFVAYVFSAEDSLLPVLLMLMSGAVAAVTVAGIGTAGTLIRKKQAGSRLTAIGIGLILACGGIFILAKSLSGYSPFRADLSGLITFAAGIALAATGISGKKKRN